MLKEGLSEKFSKSPNFPFFISLLNSNNKETQLQVAETLANLAIHSTSNKDQNDSSEITENNEENERNNKNNILNYFSHPNFLKILSNIFSNFDNFSRQLILHCSVILRVLCSSYIKQHQISVIENNIFDLVFKLILNCDESDIQINFLECISLCVEETKQKMENWNSVQVLISIFENSMKFDEKIEISQQKNEKIRILCSSILSKLVYQSNCKQKMLESSVLSSLLASSLLFDENCVFLASTLCFDVKFCLLFASFDILTPISQLLSKNNQMIEIFYLLLSLSKTNSSIQSQIVGKDNFLFYFLFLSFLIYFFFFFFYFNFFLESNILPLLIDFYSKNEENNEISLLRVVVSEILYHLSFPHKNKIFLFNQNIVPLVVNSVSLQNNVNSDFRLFSLKIVASLSLSSVIREKFVESGIIETLGNIFYLFLIFSL